MTGVSNDGDCCGWMIAAAMPGCMAQSDHEVADCAASFTGQYLKPLLERASVKPEVVEAKSSKARKAKVAEDVAAA
jgi:hypothetical protein